jgi:hypothetical protein
MNFEPTLTMTVVDGKASPFGGLAPTRRTVTPELLDQLEEEFFQSLAQGVPGIQEIDIPVTHTFTDHTYVREGIMPKGALVIGHYHREPHVCVVLKGSMSILNADRTETKVVAPFVFIAGPGRKVGYMHEDVLMQNIHSTQDWPEHLRHDVEAMEEHLYQRTAAFHQHRLRKQMSKELTE